MPKLKHVAPSTASIKHRIRPSSRSMASIITLAHGNPKPARLEYDRLVGEWLANGRRLPAA